MKATAFTRVWVICVCLVGVITNVWAQRDEHGLEVELPLVKDDLEVFPQLGHASHITFLAWTPFGKHIISWSYDSTLKVWDVESKKETRTYSDLPVSIYSMALSPDGKYVAYDSDENKMKLRDIETGRDLMTFTGHSMTVTSIAWSPDMKYIASGSDDGSVKLWDIATGRELTTFRWPGFNHAITAIAYSPVGKFIAVGLIRSYPGGREPIVKLLDVETGNETISFTGHSDNINSLAFSPDGKYLVSASGSGTSKSKDNTIKIRDIEAGKEKMTLRGHSETVTSVAFSPDGKYICSGSYDKTVKLWDAETGRELRSYRGHSDRIDVTAFSPDGKYIASGSWDETIKLWGVETGEELTLRGYTESVRSVAYSPDGKSIASEYNNNTALLWNRGTGGKLQSFAGHSGPVASLAFSPDGKYIAFGLAKVSSQDQGNMDSTIKLWDIAGGKESGRLSGHSDTIVSLAWSPDGKYIVSGSYDKTLKLWDAETGKIINSLQGHSGTHETRNADGSRITGSLQGYADYVAWSPDGKRFVSVSYRPFNIIIWDTAGGGKQRSFFLSGQGHFSVIQAALSPDGECIASASMDGTIKLWDMETEREIRTLSGHESYVTSLAWSPDGKYIVSGSYDKTVKLWDTETGVELKTLRGHRSLVWSTAYSPDGRTVVSGSVDGTVRVWDTSSGKEIAQFVAFFGEDTRLASAGRGFTEEAQTAAASSEGEWLTITPDGYYNASPRGDRYLNVRINNTVSGIDAYRSILYNPDVVEARLRGRPDPASMLEFSPEDAASSAPPRERYNGPRTSPPPARP